MKENKFFLQQEVTKYTNEKALIETAIEADKETFKRALENGLGEEIKKKVRNKKKTSFLTKIRLKLARWQTIRRCKRYEKRRLKELTNDNRYIGLY